MIRRLWRKLPPTKKQWVNTNIRLQWRKLTGNFRVLPDVLIIGASKSGTTSLFRYLSQHPDFYPPMIKEIHYFDINFHEKIRWYRAHFPTKATRNIVRKIFNRPFCSGEATPYYLYHPHAPERASQVVPNAKLIVMLRNPIERAFSDYQHTKRDGFEPLGFMEAIEEEQERLSEEIKQLQANEFYYSKGHQKFSYLSRGIYVDQLQSWMTYYSDSQFLIIKSEDFFKNPKKIMQTVFRYLRLPDFENLQFPVFNQNIYSAMDEKTRNYLSKFFRPHNKKLYDLIGRTLGW